MSRQQYRSSPPWRQRSDEAFASRGDTYDPQRPVWRGARDESFGAFDDERAFGNAYGAAYGGSNRESADWQNERYADERYAQPNPRGWTRDEYRQTPFGSGEPWDRRHYGSTYTPYRSGAFSAPYGDRDYGAEQNRGRDFGNSRFDGPRGDFSDSGHYSGGAPSGQQWQWQSPNQSGRHFGELAMGKQDGDESLRQAPKNYTRSDERIKDDICERLYHSNEVDVSEVSIEVRNGAVTLEGTVPYRPMKHRIEDIVEQCIGVHDVENRIRVARGERGGDAQAATSDSERSGRSRTPQSGATNAKH